METLILKKGKLQYVFPDGKGAEKLSGDKTNKEFEYKASILYEKKEAIPYIEGIKIFYTENKIKSSGINHLSFHYCNEKGYKKDSDDVLYTEETGTHVIFTAKANTVLKSGKAKVVRIVDNSANDVVLGSRLIGNGSIGSLSTAMYYYNVNGKDGVKLFLNGIQIHSLIEYKQDSGFDSGGEVDNAFEESKAPFDDSKEVDF